MYRPLFSSFLAGSALALVMMAATPATASHSSGGSYGSYGSYGSWGSSYGSHGSVGSHYSHGGGYARVGLLRRLHNRLHARHVYRASWHGSSGSMGSYGGYSSHGSYGSSSFGSYGSTGFSSYGSQGSWGSSYGSYGSVGGAYGSGSYYAPETYGAPMDGGAPAPPMDPMGGGAPSDGQMPPLPPAGGAPEARAGGSATLFVNVPSDAKIFVNNTPTRSVGSQRQYVSHGLQPGFTYTYEVRAELDLNGQKVEQTKVVRVRAGESTELAFDLQPAEQVVTTVTLDVPADAVVELEGNRTKATGNLRTFQTTKLRSGEQWEDYTVRVMIERDGRMLTKEQTVSLTGGETRRLSFDFDAPEIAQAR